MMVFIKHWLTERDNVTWCVVRGMGLVAGSVMIYKFIATPGEPHYQDFAVGFASICASIAFKNLSEK